MFLSAFLIFVRLFAFLCFCLVAFLCFLVFFDAFCTFGAFCAFWCFLVLLVRAKSFCKKKKKKFKTSLITSFILLLNLSYCKYEFSIITIFSVITIFFNYNNFLNYNNFFNYHSCFQLSQCFSIITISFIRTFFITIFFNLFSTCDTIFMEISQGTNSII